MKKTITKTLALLLSMTLLGACSQQSKPVENLDDVLKSAIEKTNKADSMTVDMEIGVKLSQDGQSFEMPVTSKVETQGLQSDDLIMHVSMQSKAFGTDVSTDMWYFDGMAYTEAMGMKTAVEMDLADAKAQATSELMMLDSFKNLSAETDSSGNITAIKVMPSKDELMKLLSEMGSNTLDEDTLSSLDNMEINELVYNLDTSGALSGMSFGFKAEAEGMTMDMTVKITYSKIGETSLEKIDTAGYEKFDLSDFNE